MLEQPTSMMGQDIVKMLELIILQNLYCNTKKGQGQISVCVVLAALNFEPWEHPRQSTLFKDADFPANAVSLGDLQEAYNGLQRSEINPLDPTGNMNVIGHLRNRLIGGTHHI